jgi:hypothetical protein
MHAAGRLFLVLFLVFTLVHSNGVPAAIPLVINHQGVVQVSGAPFTGTGLFRFAIFDPGGGTNLWTNDGTEIGTAGAPTAAVSISVVNGLYSVSLGDTGLTNMAALPSNIFDSPGVALRIWFNDGSHGALQLVPDHPLTSVPYAFMASMANHAATADVANTALDSIPSGLRILSATASPPAGFTFTGQRVDSAGGAWRFKAPLPEPISDAIVVTLSHKIHVFSGAHRAYDPATDNWSPLTNFPTSRYEASAAVVNGKIYVMGGRIATTLGANEVYDPVGDSWSPAAPMPQPSARSAIGVLDGKIHVVAGYTYDSVYTPLTNHQVYDPQLDSWSTAADLIDVYAAAYAGEYHGAVVRGKLYVIADNIPHEYDPETDTWTAKTPAPGDVRSDYALAETGGRIFLVSGISGVTFHIVGTAQEYDPFADSWTTHVPIPELRYYATGAGLDGKVFVLGGSSDSMGSTDQNQEFTPPGVNYIHQKD